MTSRQFPVEDSLAVLIRQCVFELLEHRQMDETICPSEAARMLGDELKVEWRDLMRGVPHPDWTPYVDHAAFSGTIQPWTWERAKSRWLTRAWLLLPGLNGEALPARDPINGGVMT